MATGTLPPREHQARKKRTLRTQALAPKIEPGAAEFLQKGFVSLNAAAVWWLEAAPLLHARGLGEMRGVFSEAELNLILDALNGCALLVAGGGGLSGQYVLFEVADAMALNQYDEKWGVEAAPLLARLRTLTHFQRVALELWAAQLWAARHKSDVWAREIARLAGDTKEDDHAE